MSNLEMLRQFRSLLAGSLDSDKSCGSSSHDSLLHRSLCSDGGGGDDWIDETGLLRFSGISCSTGLGPNRGKGNKGFIKFSWGLRAG